MPVSYPIVEVPQGQPGELQQRIASYIADLIPDGATMQMGIGEIPDAVLFYLKDKRDLGVHTELFSNGVIDLIDAGVLTNVAKTIHRGKIISGFALGSQRLYDYLDDNPLFEFHPQDYINDPFVIAQNRRADLRSTRRGDRPDRRKCRGFDGDDLLQGVGGSYFVYGERRSPGGLPIIAMRATAEDGRDQPHRADDEAGRRSGDLAQPRPHGRHRIRRGAGLRQDDRPARAQGAGERGRAAVPGGTDTVCAGAALGVRA